jgi:hypothetical protein
MSGLEDGWDDEELNIDDIGDDIGNDIGGDNVKNESGWDWDDDEDHDELSELNAWNEQFDETEPSPDLGIFESSKNSKFERVEQGLLKYIQSLEGGTLMESVNRVLDDEKNNGETALQLCHYYHARPQLREYTIDTEVPRMDYQIIISDEMILTNPVEIQEYFIEHPVDNLVDDMLLRSANQSLLADILPLITGPDNIVRMQYMASSHAKKVRFVLDLRDMRSLHVDCTMIISIPSGLKEPPKLDLASLRLMIEFSPEPSAPYVKYQLLSLTPLIDVKVDSSNIHVAASNLDPMEVEAIEKADDLSGPNFDALRDNFLRSALSAQSGFESAMRDLDGVVNISSKLNKIRTVLPVLPSIDDIVMAEEAHNQSLTGSTRETAGANLKSQASYQQQQQQPIIGGFLLSGISRLAKAAAIPVETDKFESHSNSDENNTQLYARDDNIIDEKKDTPKTKITQSTNAYIQNDVESDNIDESGWSDDYLDDELDDMVGVDSKSHDARNDDTDEKLSDKIPHEVINRQTSHLNQDELEVELEQERQYLLSKLAILKAMKNSLEETVPDDFIFDEDTRILPTRKRFVPKSEQLFQTRA